MKWINVLAALGVALTLSACSQKKLDDTPVDSGELVSKEITQVTLGEPKAQPMTYVIYYGFDLSDVPADMRAIVSQHVTFLKNNPRKRLELQGHADERGSRDYNLALGERRARGVYQMMVVSGVDPARISMVTFGEERPAAEGHNEQAWSLNRRVEFVYR
jgi:peptidoglycan-associated lipoprotein